MFSHRFYLAAAIALFASFMSGCGVVVTTTMPNATKQATEDRQLTTPHVPGSGLEVKSPNGAIDIVADPSLTEVKVTAKVTTFGETDEEAKARLEEIKVKWNRGSNQVLEIAAEIPKDKKQALIGSCSFVVLIPDAKNCTANSGNGGISFKGLGGHAEAKTDNGPISIIDQTGDVLANTGSGSIQLTKVSGHVDARTANGSMRVEDVRATVKIKSGSGSLAISKSGGDVDAHTDNGSIKVTDAGGNVKIISGSGAIDVSKPTGLVEAHTDNGPITIQDAARDIIAVSRSGQITIRRVSGAVKAKTDNGPVTLDQLGGSVEAKSGSGSISYVAATNSNSRFNLSTDNGSITVRLPGSDSGTVQAHTDNGRITVNGTRKPTSITGDKETKKIVLSEQGPQSKIHSGSGSITVTID